MNIARAAAIASLMAIAAPAFADTTTYTEPTENAFSVDVPAGWNVSGGVQRQSPTELHTWLALSSPDGGTVMFMGDPEVPSFLVPSQFAPPDTWKATMIGVSFVAPYETGEEFAANYAPRFASQSCADVKITGTQPEPDAAEAALGQFQQFAAAAGANGQPPQFDGGAAFFSCDIGGKPYLGEVIAVTSHVAPGGVGERWGVPDEWLLGGRAPAGEAGDADAVLRGLPGTFRINPQWRQGVIQQTRQVMAEIQQNGQRQMATLQGIADSENHMLTSMEQSENQRLSDQHQAFMAMMDDQEQSEKAGFDDHMRQKAIGQFNEMLYINNQHCIRYAADDPQRCIAYAQD